MTLRIGRPSKLTPATRRRLLDLIGRGTSIRRACTIAGVDEVTYYRWLSNDEQFRDDAMRSRARGIQAALDSIRQAGEQKAGAVEWRATVAWLHLVNAEEFASRKLDERYVQEQHRELVRMFMDKFFRACDELIPDPELRNRFLLFLGTHDPHDPNRLDLHGGLDASHSATPPTTSDVTPTNGHVPLLEERR
jgi:hypothetical protein